MSAQTPHIPVSESALVARVKRRLVHDGLYLKVCPWNSQWFRDLGRYYMVDERNHVCGERFEDVEDLATWAKEIGVLRPMETVLSPV